MNVMTVNGYIAKFEDDPEIDLFRGEILGLNGDADFYSRNLEELHKEFKLSLETFLKVCKENGVPPAKDFLCENEQLR